MDGGGVSHLGGQAGGQTGTPPLGLPVMAGAELGCVRLQQGWGGPGGKGGLRWHGGGSPPKILLQLYGDGGCV